MTKWKFAENFQEETKPSIRLFSPPDAHIYSPDGRERWWRAGGSECEAEEGEGEISASGFPVDEGLFLFLPLFPAPPFPLIAASASDRNLLEKNPA